MIKILQLLSSDKPIAEIRTDGRRYEVFDDRTNGLVEKFGNGDYTALLRRVARSSQLRLRTKQEGNPGVLRYMLDSGDVAEITTDGRTAILNGDILSEQQKNNLMSAIANGTVTVTHKQQLAKPSPIGETIKAPAGPPNLTSGDRRERQAEFSAGAQKAKAQKANYNHNYDPSIDNMSTEGLEWPKHVQHMAYMLKYGKAPGDV